MTGTGRTLLILGARGDLAARLLLPGLAGLLEHRDLSLTVVGVDREAWDDHGWRERVGLWQLFPLLVHAVLFGGSYGGRAADLARSLLA